jgi:hypothetical protein
MQEKIEAIRKQVIMACNPECKTYEEALECESKKDYCLFKHKTEDLYGLMKPANTLTRCELDPDTYNGKWFLCEEEVDFIDEEDDEDVERKQSAENYTILGLPLTLDRILMAISKAVDKARIVYNGETKLKIMVEHFYLPLDFEWDLQKRTLEEQKDSTIKDIHGILVVK